MKTVWVNRFNADGSVKTMSEWELIMCDDGSSDATSEVAEFYIKKYPERMVLLKNKENRGLNYTLNRCLKMATGKYIARMDGDDICLPERFAVEYEILEKEKVISLFEIKRTLSSR